MYMINNIKEVKNMEEFLITCCAPTLAGKKVGNIFNLKKTCVTNFEIKKWALLLKWFKIEVRIIKETNDAYLIYVYREILLKNILAQEQIKDFLHNYGYISPKTEDMIKCLTLRLKEKDEFPHEIGIFLGYPLIDVIGFIKNKGKCYKKCDLWKVYGDEFKCNELFKEYRKCKYCFQKMYEEGFKTSEIIEKYAESYQ